jgi:basic membrane protein A
MKRLDNATFAVVESAVNDEFQGGGVYVGTLANNGVGLAPYHDYEDAIPSDLKAEVQQIVDGISAGTIDTGW